MLNDQKKLQVDILIGADYAAEMMPQKVRRGSSRGPIATWTKLGWVLQGPIPADSSSVSKGNNMTLFFRNLLFQMYRITTE